MPVVFFPLLSLIAGANTYEHPLIEAAQQLSETGGLITRFLTTSFGMIILSILTSMIFSADESKKWAFFTASHPKGYRGQLYMKYVMLFMVFGLYFVSLYYTDALLAMLVYHVSGSEMTCFTNLYVIAFFIQLFINAWNIPFMIRFGVKNSAAARGIALVVLLFTGLVYLLFGPLPESWETFSARISGVILDLMDGKLNGMISVIVSAFPLAAVGLYLLSYRISCKLYMKGAAEYVK